MGALFKVKTTRLVAPSKEIIPFGQRYRNFVSNNPLLTFISGLVIPVIGWFAVPIIAAAAKEESSLISYDTIEESQGSKRAKIQATRTVRRGSEPAVVASQRPLGLKGHSSRTPAPLRASQSNPNLSSITRRGSDSASDLPGVVNGDSSPSASPQSTPRSLKAVPVKPLASQKIAGLGSESKQRSDREDSVTAEVSVTPAAATVTAPAPTLRVLSLSEVAVASQTPSQVLGATDSSATVPVSPVVSGGPQEFQTTYTALAVAGIGGPGKPSATNTLTVSADPDSDEEVVAQFHEGEGEVLAHASKTNAKAEQVIKQAPGVDSSPDVSPTHSPNVSPSLPSVSRLGKNVDVVLPRAVVQAPRVS